MRLAPRRLLLSAVAVLAAALTALLAHLDWMLSAGVAAVVAVSCIAEAWRSDA